MENLQQDKEKKPKKIKSKWLYYFVKITGAIPSLVWFRPKVIFEGDVKNLHKKGGVLISANHRTFIDPVLIFCAFWRRSIFSLATSELYTSRLRTWFFKGVNCIPVDKENFSMESFHAVSDCLKSDRAVLIFPEGTLNHDNSVKMMALKSGAVLMAYQAGKPILPVYIIQRKKWYYRSVVMVGEPIDVRELCGDKPSMAALSKVSELLRERELQLENKFEKGQKSSDNCKSECV